MRTKRKNRKMRNAGVAAMICMAAALLLAKNLHPFVHALGKSTAKLEIGAENSSVTAVLSETGQLTISGHGRTLDYTEESAPFQEYADQITSVKLEEGITSIGDYLFYNCGNLKGNLVLPSTVIWVGDEAFGGSDRESAPKFAMVSSKFTEAEIAIPQKGMELPPETESESAEHEIATPGEAAGGPGETTEPEGNVGETTAGEETKGPGSETGAGGQETETKGPVGGTGAGDQETETKEPAGGTGTGGQETETKGSGSRTGTGGQETETKGPTSGTNAGGQDTKTKGPGSGTGAGGQETETKGPADRTSAGSQETETTATDTAQGQSVSAQTVSLMGNVVKNLAGLTTGGEIQDPSTSHEPQESDSSDTIPEATETQPTKPEETSAAMKPTLQSSPSDATEEPEDEEEETEPTEEFSEDGTLSNDLYENAVPVSELDPSVLDRYHTEIIVCQIMGTDVFYPGQKGGYQCEGTNSTFEEAAESAGYRRSDRFLIADMDNGTYTEELAVVDGVFYAPDLPEEVVCMEGEDELFTNRFAGWILEEEWNDLGEHAPVYIPGQEITAPESRETVKLYSEWEKTCRIEPAARADIGENGTITYTVVDESTGGPMPDTYGYAFLYQWQVCETENGVYEEEIGQDEEASDLIISEDQDTEAAQFSDLSGWKDIEGAEESSYSREYSQDDARLYFRCLITVQKLTRARSAEAPVVLSSEPVSGAVSMPITISYEPGIGATGTPPESPALTGGEQFTPAFNTFTREDGQVFAGWEITFHGVTAVWQDQTSVVNNQIVSYTEPMLVSVENGAVSPAITLTAQWGTASVIYLNSGAGNDEADGLTEATAVKTLGKAYERLGTGGTVETNRIVLCDTYTISGTVNTGNVPATISGTAAGKLYLPSSNSVLQCQADTTIENLTLHSVSLPTNTKSLSGIYGMGHRLTMGYGISCTNDYLYIYGGIPSGTLQGDTHVTIFSGSYRFIYGGGYGAGDTYASAQYLSHVNGSTYVTIYGGRMWRVYGGSNIGNVSKSTNIIMFDGTIDRVWFNTLSIVGGSRYGTVSTDTSVDYSTKVEVLGGTVEQDIAGATHAGADAGGFLNKKSWIRIMGGICKRNIYGAGIDPSNSGGYCVKDGVLIQVYDGAVIEGSVFGGGFYDSAGAQDTVAGLIQLELYGGTIRGNVFGGCQNSDIVGNTDLRIYGGTVEKNLYGGGYGTKKVAGIKGNTSIHMAGGTILGNIFGGASQRGTITGSTTVKIEGGIVGDPSAKRKIFGGGEGSSTAITGTADVRIGGTATVNGSVYGAGYSGTTGSTRVALTGGTVDGDVFGGGSSIGTGTVNVEQTGGTVSGAIYGGSDSSGAVTGAVSMNIAGQAANVYGGGKGSSTSAAAGTSITLGDGANIQENVYGGGDAGTVSGGASIQMNGGTVIKGIYGGGNQAGVNGAVSIRQTGGTVAGIYGGGNQAGVNGTVSIHQTGGSVAAVYGGSNNSGTVSAPTVEINGTVGNVYGGGYGGPTVTTAPTVLVKTGGNVTGSLFGGGNLGSVTGGAAIVQEGGAIAKVFGGGNEVGVSGDVTIQQTGGTAEAVYGGSNSSGAVEAPSVTIGGTVGNLYGGGYGPSTTTTAPKVTITASGNVTGNAFGGGDLGAVTGGTSVILEGGTAANVYGGGNQVGVTGTVQVEVGQNSSATAVYGGSNDSGEVAGPAITIRGTVERVFAAGYGTNTKTTAPTVAAESGAAITELYGGGELGVTSGGTTVTLKSGCSVENTFGGGKNAGIEGTAVINTESGSQAANIYGGSNSSGSVGTVQVTVNGTVGKADTGAGPTAGSVYGGGLGQGTATASPTVTIGPTGIVYGEVYGGGAEGPVSGDTNVILANGGKITGKTYGGGRGLTAEIAGNTNVDVSVSVTGEVYGGGAQGLVKGNAKVCLKSGSQISGNVYAGGDEAAVGVKEAAGGGNTSLTAEHGAVLSGSIYGGGRGSTAIVINDTSVVVSASASGSVFGGGAEGAVYGNTHVDIIRGTIGDGSADTGNIFGGSDRAKVYGNTQVHIGNQAATEAGVSVRGETLLIHGTVFGGGNTTDNGSTFDATDPFVLGDASVSVSAGDYGSFRIKKSIFGDGNMCTVKGTRTISMKDYAAAGPLAGTSLQRADDLTLDGCTIELSGSTDSANLVTTIAYSLNRIGRLVLKDNTTLKLQAPVNLVKELVSQDASGQLVTTTSTESAGVRPSVENCIYIQQGAQMELRNSEDVTRQGYGPVTGYMLLGNYDKNGDPIVNGVYVLGGYDATGEDGGFLYAEDNAEDGYQQYQKIKPTTDSDTWRNWALGKNMTREGLLVMSNKPAGQKLLKVECPWPADGSVYRLVDGSVKINTISGTSESFTLKDPDGLTDSDPAATTLGISIRTGQDGWTEQVETGYVKGKSDQNASWEFVDTSHSVAMKTINNLSVKPTFQLELTNRQGIAMDDGDVYPLNVQFQMENVKVLSDGTEADNGILTIKLQIKRINAQDYDDILLIPGKEYTRASETYTYATKLGEAGATITKQSSITLQYAKRSTSGSNGAQDHSLSFTTNDTPSTTAIPVTLPEGTMILAVDRSAAQAVYSRYIVPAGGITQVNLSDFIVNGTANTLYGKTFGRSDSENYLFVFDFAEVPNFSQEGLCVSFLPIYNDSAADAAAQPTKIVFNVADQNPKNYVLNSPDKTTPTEEGAAYDREESLSFGLLTAANSVPATDTTGVDSQMGAQLKLKSLDVGSYMPIPTGWLVTADGNTYKSAGKQLMVPLASGMMGINTSLTMKMAKSSLPAGRYQWEISLTSSALAQYPGTPVGSPIVINFRLTDKLYSIESEFESTDRLYPSDATARTPIPIRLEAKTSGGAATDQVERVVSLWKKNETTGVYEKIALNNVFTDSSGLNGAFGWTKDENGNGTCTETLSPTLKNHVDVGTYRLKFELIRSGETVASDTGNFLIVPE